MNVVKRDGRKVEFNREKIKNAILNAGKAAEEDVEDIAEKIAGEIENTNKDLEVEEIQNLIEKKLMNSSKKDTAKAFILYREKRSLFREERRYLTKQIREKIEGKNIANQNANIDEASFGGRIGEASDVVMKDYALKYCVSKKTRENHLNNQVYIHDLSAYPVGSHNCLTIPFDDLLAKGFNTRQTDVRPAGSVNTAFQLVAVLFQLQSLQQFGFRI